jgi:putative FmdB family regulatory protein
MPDYEYKCQECGYCFERLQGFDEPPLSSCPRCGGQLRRLISARVGFIFKGTGFYATDYQKRGEEKKRSSESGTSGP